MRFSYAVAIICRKNQTSVGVLQTASTLGTEKTRHLSVLVRSIRSYSFRQKSELRSRGASAEHSGRCDQAILLAVWLGTLRKAPYAMVNVTVLAEIVRSAWSRALTATPPGPVKVSVNKVPASQQSSRQKL